METVANLVLAQMQPILTCDQLRRLGEALHYALSPKRDSCVDLIKLFLAAKEVEGCSPRTITCYESTIKHMVEAVDKSYTQIESDDLRNAELLEHLTTQGLDVDIHAVRPPLALQSSGAITCLLICPDTTTSSLKLTLRTATGLPSPPPKSPFAYSWCQPLRICARVE